MLVLLEIELGEVQLDLLLDEFCAGFVCVQWNGEGNGRGIGAVFAGDADDQISPGQAEVIAGLELDLDLVIRAGGDVITWGNDIDSGRLVLIDGDLAVGAGLIVKMTHVDQDGFKGHAVAQDGVEVIMPVRPFFQVLHHAVGKFQIQRGQFLVGQETDFHFASLQGAKVAREALLVDQRQLAVGGRFDMELDFGQGRAFQNRDTADGGLAVAGTGAVIKGGGDGVGRIGKFGGGSGGLLGILLQNHDFVGAVRGMEVKFGGAGRFSRGGEFQGHIFALAGHQVAGGGLQAGEGDVGAGLKKTPGEDLGAGKVNYKEKGEHGGGRGEEFAGADQTLIGNNGRRLHGGAHGGGLLGDFADHPFRAANLRGILGPGEFGDGLATFLERRMGAIHLLGNGVEGAAVEQGNHAAEDQGGGAAGQGGKGHDPAPGSLAGSGQPVQGHHHERGGQENGAGAGQAGLEAEAALAAEDGVKFVEHLDRHGGGIAWGFHKIMFDSLWARPIRQPG